MVGHQVWMTSTRKHLQHKNKKKNKKTGGAPQLKSAIHRIKIPWRRDRVWDHLPAYCSLSFKVTAHPFHFQNFDSKCTQCLDWDKNVKSHCCVQYRQAKVYGDVPVPASKCRGIGSMILPWMAARAESNNWQSCRFLSTSLPCWQHMSCGGCLSWGRSMLIGQIKSVNTSMVVDHRPVKLDRLSKKTLHSASDLRSECVNCLAMNRGNFVVRDHTTESLCLK